MSGNAMFHKCLYDLFLNSKRLIEFLISNVQLRKKKYLLRLSMLLLSRLYLIQMRDYLGAYCEGDYIHYNV